MAFNFSKIGKFFSLSATEDGSGSIVGVDIGSSSVKVVQIRKGETSPILETYGELQLGPYQQLDIGAIVNPDLADITEALTDILREASVTSKNAAIAIPYGASFVVVLELQPQTPDQLPSLVSIQARKYIPVPLNEVTLDWFAIPTPQENGVTKVLLAAIHNNALASYRSYAKDAGLLSSFTEIEAFSTIRSAVSNTEEMVAVVDCGASATKIFIISGGVVQEVHSVPFGGFAVTKDLAGKLKIPFAEAEELKRQSGLVGDEKVRDALGGGLDQMFSDSRRAIERSARAGGAEVSKVVLTGGGALLSGITEYCTEYFGKETVRANPFAKVGYPAFLEDTLKEAGPSFSVALGVALRRLLES